MYHSLFRSKHNFLYRFWIRIVWIFQKIGYQGVCRQYFFRLALGGQLLWYHWNRHHFSVMTGSWKCHHKILRTRISRKNILVGHYMAPISIFYWITIYFTSKPVSCRKKFQTSQCVGEITFFDHYPIEHQKYFQTRYIMYRLWLIYDS